MSLAWLSKYSFQFPLRHFYPKNWYIGEIAGINCFCLIRFLDIEKTENKEKRWKRNKTKKETEKNLIEDEQATLLGMHKYQISANNSTPLRYLEKIGLRLLLGYEYQAELGIITRLE